MDLMEYSEIDLCRPMASVDANERKVEQVRRLWVQAHADLVSVTQVAQALEMGEAGLKKMLCDKNTPQPKGVERGGHALYDGEEIVRFVKMRRVSWLQEKRRKCRIAYLHGVAQ
jgi:hypothetical protein